MAEVWGHPCARERSDAPLPLPGAAAPLNATPEEGMERGHKAGTQYDLSKTAR